MKAKNHQMCGITIDYETHIKLKREAKKTGYKMYALLHKILNDYFNSQTNQEKK